MHQGPQLQTDFSTAGVYSIPQEGVGHGVGSPIRPRDDHPFRGPRRARRVPDARAPCHKQTQTPSQHYTPHQCCTQLLPPRHGGRTPHQCCTQLSPRGHGKSIGVPHSPTHMRANGVASGSRASAAPSTWALSENSAPSMRPSNSGCSNASEQSAHASATPQHIQSAT